jgi:HD-GYP domain-containing protein (c-di-GMP phosphodiesterase class II)/DNA-binding CsgD family transcriptional regulator
MATGHVGSTTGLRLAELLATVSLASDLAHDVAAESALRDALLAVRLGRLAGWPAEDLADVYYLALLYHVGCTGAVAAQSRLGVGDDVAVRHWLGEADFTDRPELFRIAVSNLGRQWGPAEWAKGLAAFMKAGQDFPEAFANMAEVAVRLSERLGASPPVSEALGHAYARWDGKVFPGLPSGESQSAIARLVHLVHVAQTYHHVGGVESADAVVRDRSGTELDPELARLWLQNSHQVLSSLTGESVWDEALAAEPEPHRRVPPSYLDEVCRAMADFVDLKSPYTHGHSTQLARLVEDSAAELGLEQAATTNLRRAAQIHDLGNLSIPNQVWIKRGPLNPAEWARVRLHAYHSERIMSVSEALRGCGDVAGRHHERIDGSGYHRGLPAAALPLVSRLLGAAEAYQSMIEERSWRPGVARSEAAAELRREASSGKLDRRAVDAVLTAAGHPSATGRAARSWPAGLSDREVEVLRLVARGESNKQIARGLHVSEATVHTHVINLYGKTGVNTRAGATLFALEHDLIQVTPS